MHAARDVGPDHVERGASRIRRADVDLDVAGWVDAHVTKDAEVVNRENGYLGVDDLSRSAPDFVEGGRHHCAPGCARWRCCISASMYPKSSVCSPRRPPVGAQDVEGRSSVAARRTWSIDTSHAVRRSSGWGATPRATRSRVTASFSNSS